MGGMDIRFVLDCINTTRGLSDYRLMLNTEWGNELHQSTYM
jgi:hypothetical protein